MSNEALSTSVKFVCFYTKDGASVTGLTVTADVRQPDGTEIVTAAAATEIGDGFYSYTLAGGSTGTEGEYLACFKTAGDVDQAHLPSLWSIGRGGVENLDAAVSSRNATTPPTVAAIRGEMDSNSSKLDVAVSTRATPDDVTTAVSNVVSGTGSATYTDTVLDDNDDPIYGAEVKLRTDDNEALTPADRARTDTHGTFTVRGDPGDYFLFVYAKGFTGGNPIPITIEEDS